MLLLARGSYPTPACFPPKTLVLRVVGVKGPQAYPAGSWERPDLGGELGGGSQNSCVPCFSATGSDPINPMASAVLSQAGRLCVMSAPLLVGGNALRGQA